MGVRQLFIRTFFHSKLYDEIYTDFRTYFAGIYSFISYVSLVSAKYFTSNEYLYSFISGNIFVILRKLQGKEIIHRHCMQKYDHNK